MADLFDNLARLYDVDRDDPRLNKLIQKMTDGGQVPQRVLDSGIDVSRLVPPQSRDPRQDISAARTATTDDTPVEVKRQASPVDMAPEEFRPIASQLAQNPNLIGPSLDRGLNEGTSRFMTYPNLALDAITAGGFRRARNAIGEAVDPESIEAVKAMEGSQEQMSPFAANTARAIGYVSPVGIPAVAARGTTALVNAGKNLLPAQAASNLALRPVTGAAIGAGTGGLTSSAEASMAGGSPEEIAEAGKSGAKFGGVIGAGAGALSAARGSLGNAAQARKDSRLLGDITEGSTATKRDKIVGRGGEKADRAVDTARRAGLEDVRGAKDQLGTVESRIDDIGAALDDVYQGKGPFGEPGKPAVVNTSEPIDRLLNLAAELEKSPQTIDMANDVVREAEKIYQAWGNASVPASEVRRTATALGKTLFKNNPNADRSTAAQVRTRVYGELVDTISKAVEKNTPGGSGPLASLNAEMSDLLNMHGAIESRAARESTPSTRLAPVMSKVGDAFLAVTDPTSLVLKKGLEYAAPKALRGADNFLANSRFSESNPLLQALEASAEQNRRRAELMRGTQ